MVGLLSSDISEWEMRLSREVANIRQKIDKSGDTEGAALVSSEYRPDGAEEGTRDTTTTTGLYVETRLCNKETL